MRAFPSVLLILFNLAFPGSAKENWKYAGEDHGLRFFFQARMERHAGRMNLKVENTRPVPMAVSFRVRDTDWKRDFVKVLEPFEEDSTLSFVPEDGLPVRYPYIDRVYVEWSGFFSDETAKVSDYGKVE